MKSKLRVGIGFDTHALAQGRRLIVGGVEIPHDKGLIGWSDGDVLSHAIIDALLGAAAMGDIGSHFPPGEPQYQGISSLDLLKTVREKLMENGFKIINIDATIMAEQPKFADFIAEMQAKLSQSLGITLSEVSIKASTTEKLGFTGRGEGIAALAVAMLEEE